MSKLCKLTYLGTRLDQVTSLIKTEYKKTVSDESMATSTRPIQVYLVNHY